MKQTSEIKFSGIILDKLDKYRKLILWIQTRIISVPSKLKCQFSMGCAILNDTVLL